MATMVSRIDVDELVVFDCPICGVHHAGPLMVETESETVDMEVGLLEPIWAFVRQTWKTSACDDVFVVRSIMDEPTYEVTLTTHDDHSRPTLLHVAPRNVSQR
jgi:hypothetical protein